MSGGQGPWIVVNVGCIECGVSSGIVGVFDSLDVARKVIATCYADLPWRGGGQNDFEVFDLSAPPADEYSRVITKATGGEDE